MVLCLDIMLSLDSDVNECSCPVVYGSLVLDDIELYRTLRSVEGDLATGILEGLLDCLGLFDRLYAKEPLLLTDDLPILSFESERLMWVGILDGIGLLRIEEVSDLLPRLSFENDLEKVLIPIPSYTSLEGDFDGVESVKTSSAFGSL